jgi:diguanylate cyclase (GGDEF)-like protein
MQRFLTILRQMLRRLGVVRAVAVTTLASAILSLTITTLVMLGVYGTIGESPLLITLSVSLPVSALFSTIAMRLMAHVEELHEELEILAHTDQLTGLANRRAFLLSAAECWPRPGAAGGACAIIVFDIDHFKLINDQHGHAVGDCALRHVAERCRETLGTAAFGARIGGEEFAILLPRVRSSEAAQRAEELRTMLAAQMIPCGDTQIQITASFGVADSSGAQVPFDQAWIDADRALYRAKSIGRNQVVVSQPLAAID